MSGMAAAITNDAFETKFVAPSRLHDPDASAAFHIIKATRNAWTHKPMHPFWHFKNPKDRVPRTVSAIKLTVDFTNLEGVFVDGAHFGSWAGFINLLGYCRGIV